MIIPKKIWLVAFMLISQFAYSQDLHMLRGRVIADGTMQPIENASIRLAGSEKTSVSDRSGNFKIFLTRDTATLRVSYIGYSRAEIRVSRKQNFLTVILKPGMIDLKEVQISLSRSASFNTLSALDLNLRPVNSSQELMRLVPGLFIAQHMGGGKAEQIFIRGFDADHGTDINVSVDGLPVNMVSHIHGQGYADLHFLIPETVSVMDYGKGPYYTEKGDFTTAGYLSFTTKDALEKNVISLEAGRFNAFRAIAMVNLLDAEARKRGKNWYVASEYNYTDGPFTFGERYKRLNFFTKYTNQLSEGSRLSLSASAFTTSWRASGEIPERAVFSNTLAIDENGKQIHTPGYAHPIGRFGVIDSLQGGNVSRYTIMAKLNTRLGKNVSMENQAYYTRDNFLLHVNSTFLADTAGGEREHKQGRDLFGYLGKLSLVQDIGDAVFTSAIGVDSRFDRTFGSERSFISQQYKLIKYFELGNIRQNNSAVYLDETLRAGKWLFNAGIRLDYFKFNFHDSTKTNKIVSPKLNIEYMANEKMQFYVKMGKGFHSNNAITVIGNSNFKGLPAAYGIDLGLNWKPISHLYINTAFWYLYLQQEFVYSDDGDIVPGGKTKRYGLDIAARYQFSSWLFADLNLNAAHPRLADMPRKKNYLALAPTFTSTGGLDFKLKNGINGGLSYRYLETRPGNNLNTLVAKGYFVTDLKINYTCKRYELGLTIENLLNTRWNEFEAEEISRLKGESAPVDQMSFTPGTPFAAKLRLAVFF